MRKVDLYQQIGKNLRALMVEDIHTDLDLERVEEVRKKGKQIRAWAKELKQPILEKGAKEFEEKLERFLSHPEDKKIAKEAAKKALELEQETREI